MHAEPTDISRMISFILHEAKEKVSEIKIRATEEYKLTRARVIKKLTDSYIAKKQEKIEQVRKYYVTKQSQIKTKYRIIMQAQKEKIIQQLFSMVKQRVQSIRTTDNLLNNTIERIKYYDNNKYTIDKNYGVIIKSNDQKTTIDNSYNTRIENIKRNYMDKISTAVFN